MAATAWLTGLLVTSLLGIVLSVYLWRIHRTQLETLAGLQILGGMRWRELSRLVASALGSLGFENVQQEQGIQDQHADMVVHRDGRPWLISCKQGRDYNVSKKTVDEVQRSLIYHNAAGGLIATPGRVSKEALKASSTIQILHGRALWNALSPLLPLGVRIEVVSQARAITRRHLALAWAFALTVGAISAWAVSLPQRAGPQNILPQPAVIAKKPRKAEPIAELSSAEVPLSASEQRAALGRELMTLPGVGNAIWVSESTLQIMLEDASLLDDSPSICSIVERYQGLRATRLQLQPPPRSGAAVRFRQCRAF